MWLRDKWVVPPTFLGGGGEEKTQTWNKQKNNKKPPNQKNHPKAPQTTKPLHPPPPKTQTNSSRECLWFEPLAAVWLRAWEAGFPLPGMCPCQPPSMSLAPAGRSSIMPQATQCRWHDGTMPRCCRCHHSACFWGCGQQSPGLSPPSAAPWGLTVPASSTGPGCPTCRYLPIGCAYRRAFPADFWLRGNPLRPYKPPGLGW